jgi:hypothetical protein
VWLCSGVCGGPFRHCTKQTYCFSHATTSATSHTKALARGLGACCGKALATGTGLSRSSKSSRTLLLCAVPDRVLAHLYLCTCRPDPRSHFVQPSDAAHPHLPDTPGLYRMVPPRRQAGHTRDETKKSERHRSVRVHSLDGSFDLPMAGSGSGASSTSSSRSSSSDGHISLMDTLIGSHDEIPLPSGHASLSHALPPSAAALAPPAPAAPSSVPLAGSTGNTNKSSTKEVAGSTSGAAVQREGAPSTLRDAVLQFMNHPHPLTTLTEYGAYGTNGTISRYVCLVLVDQWLGGDWIATPANAAAGLAGQDCHI